jgi:hypothetical protein
LADIGEGIKEVCCDFLLFSQLISSDSECSFFVKKGGGVGMVRQSR